MNQLIRKIDPCNNLSTWKPQTIVSRCGFIPRWIEESYFGAVEEVGHDKAFEFVLDHYYGHFMPSHSMGGSITEDGVYQYEGDPDLYPLISYIASTRTLYQYDYGIVIIVDNATRETVFAKRMD